MKQTIRQLLAITLTLPLWGCGIGGQWMTGNPFHDPIKSYLHYWEKPGMTEESRREDSWGCGAARTLHAAVHVVFPSEVEKAERRLDDKDEMAVFWRLRDKWNQCMESKGYVYVWTAPSERPPHQP